MWTPATRRQHSRAGPRYESDLTVAERRLMAPLLPAPKRTGRPLSWPLREIENAILYVMRGGIAWRLLPSDLPANGTAYRWFATWRDGGVFEVLNHALLMIDRERSSWASSPSVHHRQPELEDQRSLRLARLQRRQEDHESQAPRPRRHRQAWPRLVPPPGQRSGSRWGESAAGGVAPPVSFSREGLRRRQVPRPARRDRHPHRRRDRPPQA